MILTARLLGLDALSLKVKYLRDAAQVGLKLGASEAAGLIQQEAQALVPVDTGNLRDHIHIETLRDETEKQVIAVTPAYAASNDWGFDPAYARRIEYGFMGTDRLGRTYHQPAQPYMRPAADNKRDEALEAIKRSIYDELNAASDKVAANRLR